MKPQNACTHRQKPHPARRREGGYNLIEISLACFILGIGIVSIITIFPLAVGIADASINRKAAGLAAEAVRTHMQYCLLPGIDKQPDDADVSPSNPNRCILDDVVDPLPDTNDTLIDESGMVGKGKNEFKYLCRMTGKDDAILLNCTILIYRNADGDTGATDWYGVYKTLLRRPE